MIVYNQLMEIDDIVKRRNGRVRDLFRRFEAYNSCVICQVPGVKIVYQPGNSDMLKRAANRMIESVARIDDIYACYNYQLDEALGIQELSDDSNSKS